MVVGDTFILPMMLLLHKNLITTYNPILPVQYLVLFREIDMVLHHYGNTGCGVFKRGYKIRKIFA